MSTGYIGMKLPNHQKPQRSMAGLHTTDAPGAHHGGFGCVGAHGGGMAGATFGSAFATPLPMRIGGTLATPPIPRMPAPMLPAAATAAATRLMVVVLPFSLTAFTPHASRSATSKTMVTTPPGELASLLKTADLGP